MPGSKGVDLLAKFVKLEGGDVEAESTDTTGWKDWELDPLLLDFMPDYTFEVFNFDFGAGVEIPGIAGTGSRQRRALAGIANIAGIAARQKDALADLMRGQNQQQSPEGERSWQFSDPNKLPVEVQPIKFSRAIDKASSNLLMRCFESQYFESVSIAKRRSVGKSFSGYTYLRMNFSGVMLTNIDWSNDDEVQENITFVARSVEIQYRPVLPSGDLGTIISARYDTPSRAAQGGM